MGKRLETSASGKTHASYYPAQAQPPLPERLPAGCSIGGTAQKSSQLRHTENKLLDGQPLDGHPLLAGDQQRLLWLDPGQSWLLGLVSTQIAQLQQAHGYGRDDSQQIGQTALLLQMPLLQSTAGFDSTMKILNGPPRLVIVDRLPGLLAVLHWQGTEQNPFQSLHLLALRLLASLGAMFVAGDKGALSLLLAGRLWLPHTHYPQRQRLTCCVGASLRSKQLHGTPTELDLSRSGPSFMLTWHLDAALGLRWPGFGPIE